jgi:hypothetical protein
MAGFCLLMDCEKENDEPLDSPELLKQVLFDFYDGIEVKDYDKIMGATTPDFMLYMEGQAWSYDSIVNALTSYPPYSVDYSFDNFNIYIENSIGYLKYLCRGDFVFSDTVNFSIIWNESATFIKADDQWKMKFMHSTTTK